VISFATGRLLAAVTSLLMATLALGAVSASAEPSPPDCGTSPWGFGELHSAADPEDFCWEVQLDPDQVLRQVDDQQAEVVYADDEHHAFSIAATPAHDADGSAVPTTIAVTGPTTILFTVHHRAGNPLLGGAPFVYPVTAGVGWEGGFQPTLAEILVGEYEAKPAGPVPTCVVPDLRGWKLKPTRTWLRRAQCGLGKVRGERRSGAKVVKQSRTPGTVLPFGARVAVKLG
jgi:hypothetical protein